MSGVTRTFRRHLFAPGEKWPEMKCACGAVTWAEQLAAWHAAGEPHFTESLHRCETDGVTV